MGTSKLTTKRVLGLGLASALAVARQPRDTAAGRSLPRDRAAAR